MEGVAELKARSILLLSTPSTEVVIRVYMVKKKVDFWFTANEQYSLAAPWIERPFFNVPSFLLLVVIGSPCRCCPVQVVRSHLELH